AYLAALPKAPENYHPFRKTERAITRRNFVLRRMLANGFITRAVFEREKALPLNVNPRPFNSQLFAGEYFAEEVRRTLVEMFGEDKTVGGGLSVRTTMVPSLQRMAKKALVDGLVRFDRRKGWRGPVSSIDMNGDWHRALHNIVLAGELEPWRLAVVTKVDNKQGLLVALRSTSGRVESSVKLGEPELVRVPVSTTRWTKRGRVSRWLKPGDVIYVAPNVKKDGTVIADQWRLMQKPAVDGGIVAMDPHTGRVLALVGGFTFGLWKGGDQFNRATTANRQPGSAFKPLVYAAAIDNGYTPATLVNDAPIVIDQGPGKEPWKPSNYGKNFAGPSTLRTGIVRSKNLMTVRLARDVGMPLITEYARRFDVYDNLPPFLSMSLGAGETKLIRMTTAYAMLANGGRQVEASLIDRIQDRYGRTVWRHDQKACSVCEPQAWAGQEEPELDDKRLQIIDPHTAYQMTSIMEDVVQRGTGQRVKAVGKPIAGKTGTTNDEKDAWFVGYSPDLVVGVYVGYDQPQPMGKGETGGSVASPIFRDFMKMALADTPAIPFRRPPGIKLIRVDRNTGARGSGGASILEAFKPENEPVDAASQFLPSGEDPSLWLTPGIDDGRGLY
ncbi:MAG: penicillin-binding transpeptidase domain-containing protein, partial [Pseudomonadota bacterium]